MSNNNSCFAMWLKTKNLVLAKLLSLMKNGIEQAHQWTSVKQDKYPAPHQRFQDVSRADPKKNNLEGDFAQHQSFQSWGSNTASNTINLCSQHDPLIDVPLHFAGGDAEPNRSILIKRGQTEFDQTEVWGWAFRDPAAEQPQ